MTTEVTVVSDENAEEAAYLAEMASESDVVAEAPEEVVVEAPAEVVPEVAAEAVVERKEVIAGYTEEEIRSALEQLPKLQKAIDTTAGTFGSRLADQQRKLEEMAQQRNQTVGKLSAEKMTRLSKEFPELADLLAQDLNDVIQGQTVDTSQIENNFNSKLIELEEKQAKAERSRELKELSKQHKDWKEVASFTVQGDTIAWNNPKFGEYVSKLPVEEQNKLVAAWDADFVAEKLTGFKDSIKPKVVEKKQNDVLEAAIIPRGTRSVTPSNDLSEEEAAFRAEMAKR